MTTPSARKNQRVGKVAQQLDESNTTGTVIGLDRATIVFIYAVPDARYPYIQEEWINIRYRG